MSRVLPVATVDSLGDAPVHHRERTEVVDHDVGGFDIAVNDVPLVGVGNCLTNALEDVHETEQGSAVVHIRRIAGAQDLRQRLPVDALHSVELLAAFQRAGVVHGHGPGVGELGQDARLLHKTPAHLGACGNLGPHGLDRDATSQVRVLGLLHDGHTALADHFTYLVTPGRGRRCIGGGRCLSTLQWVPVRDPVVVGQIFVGHRPIILTGYMPVLASGSRR